MGRATHLIVDGANVVQAWPGLRKLSRRDRVAARDLLVSRLRAIRDAEDIRITVVFDGRRKDLSVEHDGDDEGFTVIVSPSSVTADDVIEKLVGRSGKPGDCIVATADRLERQTVEATGASALSPEELEAWIARAETRRGIRVGRFRRESEERWRRRT